MKIIRVGVDLATALAAALGDGHGFRRGRDFAVSLGLTPRQHSSGGRATLLGISKRGDSYLPQILIHGARAAVRTAPDYDDPLWIQRLSRTKHANVVVVAVANKTARMAWALIHKDMDYDPRQAAGLAEAA